MYNVHCTYMYIYVGYFKIDETNQTAIGAPMGQLMSEII